MFGLTVKINKVIENYSVEISSNLRRPYIPPVPLIDSLFDSASDYRNKKEKEGIRGSFHKITIDLITRERCLKIDIGPFNISIKYSRIIR